MPDLPDFYMWTETILAKVTSVDHGLDASKSATPVAGDVYLATDTKILYVCNTDGSWKSCAILYLLLAGGTMSGAIAMGDNAITGLPAPAANGDAARKKYVDDEIDTDVGTHAALATGVHGVGADYLAKAAASQYTAVNRAGDANLGQTFSRSVDNGVIVFCGDTSANTYFAVYGKDHAINPSYFRVRVVAADLAAGIIPLQVSGATDTPEIYPEDDNLIGLGTAAKRWKLVRGVTGTFGDMKLENGWGFTEHPEHGIAVRAPSGKLYKMNLEEIK